MWTPQRISLRFELLLWLFSIHSPEEEGQTVSRGSQRTHNAFKQSPPLLMLVGRQEEGS